ncbi:nucleotide exchange factor GrpE [Malaciobacter molluscorum LMG 25693]|uniref:Protein GrpE n=1 Tax=Malaciobacter molluscorum LMG 25693 TaxID=870501 RepID=A0A2G1DEW0_9BACT|nr:nucleotide exchange factor GrpE [Malaciobacter molluscorum]AXX93519.1 DnaK system nucleotide exchange factor GrpE [Malaciobacter molluscorum LMG 25693]PHO16980.1 nucleotide exchange factor GrpE [Malaciobacter molluscorum LMG 25693]RXJ93809.1 nucleotide exchange factor GrpE [Malaciobacter molluscorum]
MSEEKKEKLNQEEVVETCENQTCEDNTEQEVSEQQEQTVESVKAEYEAKLKEEQDKYLRVHADFENIKKRLEKEKYQAIDYASEKFAKDLLVPIDTLEMALAAEESSKDLDAQELLKKLKEGVELTIKNFYTVFEKHEITPIDTDGEFDPNFHDAVMQVDSEDHEDGQIVQQLQKGYKYKDRLLRPAMVSICKK